MKLYDLVLVNGARTILPYVMESQKSKKHVMYIVKNGLGNQYVKLPVRQIEFSHFEWGEERYHFPSINIKRFLVLFHRLVHPPPPSSQFTMNMQTPPSLDSYSNSKETYIIYKI